MRITFVSVLLLALALCGCGRGSRRQVSQPDLPGTSAETLVADYKANEVAAGQKYGKGPIQVWGRLKKIEPGIVTLNGKDEYDTSVRCSMKTGSEGLADLKPGDIVVLTGDVRPDLPWAIYMVHCTFTPPVPYQR